MQYSEIELKKMTKLENMDIEEQIKFNILNFIRTIHLNKQDFIQESYNTKFFGDLPMTFKKKGGQVMGLITVSIKNEEQIYIFNDHGYEPMDDLLELKNS